MLPPVCLISSNDISREGLGNLLKSEGFEVCGALEDVSQIDPRDFDVATLFLLDSPPVEAQVEAVSSITQLMDNASVVVLASSFDLTAMIDCFRSGARGYIIKAHRVQPLMAALKLAAIGERVLPPDLVDVLDQRMAPKLPSSDSVAGLKAANLSPREVDVLACLIEGYPNKVIARELEVCEATVKVHVKAILRKLNVKNRTQAAIWANSRGISHNYGPSAHIG